MAVASHESELVGALSSKTLAQRATPGTDIYELFVEQKTSYLLENGPFFDGGPLENAWRALLASSLEAKFFTRRARGEVDPSLIKSAISRIDEILVRLTDPRFRHLQSGPQASAINSNEFWRALLQMSIGERTEARKTLQDIAHRTRAFGLVSNAAGHIYLYRVYNLPHKIVVQHATGSEGVTAKVDDPYLVDKYFNPAQLSLFTCSLLSRRQATPNDLAQAIGNFENHDYYVVASSSGDVKRLQDVVRRVDSAFEGNSALSSQRDQILQRLTDFDKQGFANAASAGASECGIDETARNSIYEPFRFRPQILGLDSRSNNEPAREANHLVYGGRLNAAQASLVAEFLNKSVYPVAKLRANKADPEVTASVARMKVN